MRKSLNFLFLCVRRVPYPVSDWRESLPRSKIFFRVIFINGSSDSWIFFCFLTWIHNFVLKPNTAVHIATWLMSWDNFCLRRIKHVVLLKLSEFWNILERYFWYSPCRESCTYHSIWGKFVSFDKQYLVSRADTLKPLIRTILAMKHFCVFVRAQTVAVRIRSIRTSFSYLQTCRCAKT